MEQTEIAAAPQAPVAKKQSLRRTVLAYAMVASLAGLVFTLEMRRQESNEQLASLAERLDAGSYASADENKAEAQRIVTKVRELIELPANVDPTVATIVDVEKLKSRNDFYKSAKNGDYLLVTTERAIIYDPDAHRIKDVVPVQIQPVASATDAGEGVK